MRPGKFPPRFMDRSVYANLGSPRSTVLVGPGAGLDNGVVSLGGRKVMVLTTDPVSVIPRMGMELSAWMSVHLVASDLATSGIAPSFATFSYNFPSTLEDADCATYLKEVGRACKGLGVTIVGGHTGRYPGATLTVVGAGTMFGLGDRDGYVTPAMASPGDMVLVTKGAAIEAAVSLAWSFPETTETRVGRNLARSAREMVRECSTVEDSLVAAKAGLGSGAVTSMHDATEGGVLGALGEMAAASRKRFVVDLGGISVSEAAGAVCDAFAIDPLRTVSEGALLITCSEGVLGAVEVALGASGIAASVIGKVERGAAGVFGSDGSRVRIAADPYWEAFARAASAGLS